VRRKRHSLRGVWVEIELYGQQIEGEKRHSLRGVWVEIDEAQGYIDEAFVTPFGECGLKYPKRQNSRPLLPSLPSGSVG